MSSINFNSHDEYFQPDADYAPVPIYSVHPIPELRMYSSLAKKYGVKQEIECFNTGAYWAIGKIRGGDFWTEEGEREIEEDLLPEPLWLTLFFGWDGQGWTPPTAKGLQYMVDHLPPRANFSMSCMEPPNYWSMVAHTIAIGGHVRVGMEDCPFVEDGVYAKTNAELVEKAVRIAHEVGRDIASAHEARAILESYPLEAMTANTITDIDALIGQFKAFYDQGYAIEREENEIGGLCISAPIHNHSSNPVAAVSVSFPLSRLDETMIATYGTKILEVARRISVKLGHHLEPRSLSYASEAQAAAGS